jgi:hypothetical protein
MRKEVHLKEETIRNLQALADKKKWSLKKYMEETLERQSLKNVKCKKEDTGILPDRFSVK